MRRTGFSALVFLGLVVSLTFQLKAQEVSLVTSDGVLSYSLRIPSFELVNIETGETRIIMEDASFGLEPGYPMLPILSYTFALPPGTRADRVEVSGSRELLPGAYTIEPRPAPLPVGYPSDAYLETLFEKNKQKAYHSSNSVPELAGELVSISGQREYSLASVAVYPFSYRPLTGKISCLNDATITIHYSPMRPDEANLVEEFLRKGSMNLDVPKYIYNIAQAKEWYMPSNRLLANPRMLILTTDALLPSTGDYVDWRESLGFQVETITIENILASEIGGLDTPQKIRNWLRENAADYDFLFIIGHYNDIPMRKLHGRGEDPLADPIWVYPAVSDIYYGDISAADRFSWDFDQDGLYGEVVTNDENPTADMPDIKMELHVGRINSSDAEKVQDILDNIRVFESSSDLTYKKSAVASASIPFYRTAQGEGLDGAIFMEYLQDHGILVRSLTTSLYEKEGDLPSIYDCDFPETQDNLISALKDNDVGIFVEYNHGSPVDFARFIVHDENENGLYDEGEEEWFTCLSKSDAWKLNTAHPNTAFLMSCLNGRAEESLCLAQALLQSGSVASVAHTRVSYSGGWHTPENGGFECLFYEDIKAFVEDEAPLGQAVSDARPVLKGKEPSMYYLNDYTHVLYGDPAFKLYGYSSDIAEKLPMIKPASLTLFTNNSIRFSLSKAGYARVEMWDVAGRRVSSLMNGWVESGEQIVSWDEANLASGTYFVTLRTPGLILSTKAVVVK